MSDRPSTSFTGLRRRLVDLHKEAIALQVQGMEQVPTWETSRDFMDSKTEKSGQLPTSGTILRDSSSLPSSPATELSHSGSAARSVSSARTLAQTNSDLLDTLRAIKNDLIGNVWRKVEFAKMRDGMDVLVAHLQIPQSLASGLLDPSHIADATTSNELNIGCDIASEAGVILGSLANVGDLTLRYLLVHPFHLVLLSSIKTLADSLDRLWSRQDPKNRSIAGSTHMAKNKLKIAIQTKYLPNLLKALRSLSLSCAEYLWGALWGVGIETILHTTGNETFQAEGSGSSRVEGGPDVFTPNEPELQPESSNKGNGESGSALPHDAVKTAANRIVESLFKPASLSVMAPMMHSQSHQNILLPLLQMYASLAQTSRRRRALVAVSLLEESAISVSSSAVERDSNPSRPRFAPQFSSGIGSPLSLGFRSSVPCCSPRPFIRTLADLAVDESTNGKAKQAALQMLATICRDERDHAAEAINALRDHRHQSPSRTTTIDLEQLEDILQPLLMLLSPRPSPIATAAAEALVNILKATPQSMATRTGRELFSRILSNLLQLLDQSSKDVAVILYNIAHLVADDPELQRKSSDTDCLDKLIAIVKEIQPTAKRQQIGEAAWAKTVEACFICMASLALSYEQPRAAIAEADLLPFIKMCLTHESYGVRSSACQVARALSRSVAILRTNLVDSGIATEIFALLKQEESKLTDWSGRSDVPDKLDSVAIAATATLCNLITEFSPMQTAMIEEGGIELLVRLCDCPSQATRTNALWALRNMLYKNDLEIKKKVMALLTWRGLLQHIRGPTVDIQEQGLALLRNVVCEGTEEEVTVVAEGLGESQLLDLLSNATRPATDNECLEQALYILYNIALANDHYRRVIVERGELVDNVKSALTAESSLIKVPALGTFLNLVEANDRTRKPRQEIVQLLKPYLLEPILQSLSTDPTFDVREKAQRLLSALGGTSARA